MKRDCEREKDKVWKQATRDIGIFVTPEAKEAIDEIAGSVDDQEDLPYYESTVYEQLAVLKKQMAFSYLPEPKEPKNPPEKRYQGPFKKRLYLVKFVIIQQLASKKQRSKIRKTIKWQDICRVWNKDHPNDQTTPEHLKRTFYRAISQNDVQQEFKKEMGMFILQALWVGRLSQVLDDVDMIEQWAYLFASREMFQLFMGKPLDDQQKDLEIEAVNNPDVIYERRKENARKALAIIHGIDLSDLKKMSDKELIEISKSKKGVQNEQAITEGYTRRAKRCSRENDY